jgi:hypothetical protein
MGWAVPVVAAALTGVLSSGVTAVYLRSTEPETVAIDVPREVTPEQRHLAALLVAPAAPYTLTGPGKPVDTNVLGGGLDALGFVRGWTQSWRTPDKQTVDSFVLEFADPAGADAYARGIGNAATLLTRPRPFSVTGVPGGSGLLDTVADKDGNYAGLVVMRDGVRAVLLVLATKSPGAGALDLAQRQWAALSAA